jgi:succinoglycan biosynthesis transport protein ExoP
MLWVNQTSPSSHDKASGTDAPLFVLLLGFLTSLVRRQFPIFLVMVSCALAIGLVFLFTTPARYTAVATMVLETRKVPIFEQQQQIIGDAIDNATVDTQVDVLTSDNVARAVVKALDLTDDPEFVGPDTGPFSAISNFIFRPTSPEPARSVSLMEQRALDRFAEQLSVRRRPRTHTMEISFRSLDPAKSARIANAVVDAYISDQLESKYQSTRRATEWLLNRINTLRDQASADMKALVEFKQKNNLVASDGKLINDQQMSEVNSQLILAHAAVAEAKARVDLIQKVMTEENPSSATADALRSEVIIKLRQQYLDYAAREAILSKKYGQNHLATIALRNQMFELRRSIADEMGKIAQTYRNEYEIALTRETSLRDSLTAAVTESIVTEHAQVQLRELESNAQTSRTMYDSFLQKYMEAVQQQSFPVSDARLISAALPPVKKSEPKTLVVLAMTTIAGLIAAFGVAALREVSDSVFRTGAKVEDVLGVTCITLLPVLKNTPPDTDDKKDNTAVNVQRSTLHQVIRSPFSRFTESLRALKVIVDLNSCGKTKKVIGLTSSLPNEGKSTIAANFSALIAHSGSRVILVDGDLRNPSLSQHLGSTATVGLVDVVAGNATLDAAIWNDPASGLAFLAAGTQSTKLSHPNDFLGSPVLKALIDKLRDSYDYIIVDLPPLAPVVDTRMTTGFIDSYVYVVEWGQTRVNVVQHSLSNAREIYDRLLGVVLNKVNLSMLEHYERHRTDYYYRQYSSYKHID